MDQRLMQVSFAVDERHWWYRGRRAVIAAELARLDLPAPADVLDAGCGSGQTLVQLSRLGHCFGVELDEDAAALARSRGDFEIVTGPVEDLPWDADSFDLVTCLDVIEHTPDDVATLQELRRVIRPGGRLVVTVPAYQWLWSHHDVLNRHHRRYTAGTLMTALKSAGWVVERVTYFNSILLPAAAAVRLLQRRESEIDEQGRSDLELSPRWLDGVLQLPLLAEARLLRAGGKLPAGLSVLAVARSG